MGLSKTFAWIVGIFAVIAVAAVVLYPKNKSQIIYQNSQQKTVDTRKADDPTYGQEIRALTAKLKLAEDQFQQQSANSDKTTRQLNETILNLQGQLQQLNTDSKDKDSQNAELQKLVTTLSGQVKKLSEEKSAAEATGSALKSQLDTFSEEIAKLKNTFEEKQSLIGDLQTQLQNKLQETPALDKDAIANTVKSILATNQANQTAQANQQATTEPTATAVKPASQNYQPYRAQTEQASSGKTTNLASLFNAITGNDEPATLNTEKDVSTTTQTTAVATADNTLGTTTKTIEVEPVEPLTVFPVYTLPVTTMLTDSTLLTPLIGRVPFGGNVNDPFKFQLEFGAANLAANGHTIPGVSKAIATGIATGNREQSCVRGTITAMTFIFEDGRIHTVGGNGQRSTQGGLGYLADPTGKPCIYGQYINNAGQYLRGRSFAAFLEGLAAAYGQSQITQNQSSTGTLTSFVSGNTYQFAAAQGLANTASEIADYIGERAVDAFDVVYVPQATTVQMIVEQQINIDYDTKARKINYLNDNNGVSYD